MEEFTKEDSKAIKSKVEAPLDGQTIENTQVVGRIIKCMEMDN